MCWYAYHVSRAMVIAVTSAIVLSVVCRGTAFMSQGRQFALRSSQPRACGYLENSFLTARQTSPTARKRPRAQSGHRTLVALSSRTPSWRYEIDDLVKAISPWGSVVEAEIIATDLVKRLPEVAKDVSDAARRGTLVSEVLLAEGTEARYNLEGLTAVNRQLQEDILPQALEAAPRLAKTVAEIRPGASGGSGKASSRRSDSVAGRSSSTRDSRTGPMEGVAEGLYAVRNAAKDLSPNKVTQGLKTVTTELENIVSRKPKGLYSPSYSVEDRRGGFEIRRYESYSVVSAPMTVDSQSPEAALNPDGGVTTGSGEGFNTLAGYLFGDNAQERAMDMTTPVNIDVGPSGGRNMSFVMPKDVSAQEAPSPRDPRVGVTDVDDGELYAVREFPGFATDGEVKRQLDALLGALEREANTPQESVGGSSKDAPSVKASSWRAEDPAGGSYRLMQYNPPYTLPWRRSNALAVRVIKDDDGREVEL